MSDDQKQVALQCKAVAHLATAIAQIHTDYEKMFGDGKMSGLADQVGKRTAAWMETLGEMLNSIDAAEEEDEWLEPIFREAQRRWLTETALTSAYRGDEK